MAQPLERKEVSPWVPLIGGVLFFLLGWALLFESISRLSDAQDSTGWPTTTGTVLESDIHDGVWLRNKKDADTHYQPTVEYTYTVDGTAYTNDRVSFTEHSGSTERSWAEDIVDRFPIGAEVTVYYKPGAPDEAVLDPGVDQDNYVVLVIAIGTILAGAAAAVVGWVMRQKKIKAS